MRKALEACLPSVISILVSLFACFLAVGLTRGFGTAASAFAALTWGAFGDWPRFFSSGESSAVLRPLGESGSKAALLTLTGLSVAVAFRVGLFNIGAQGQLMVGALAAAVVGAKLEAPAWLHLALCLVAAGSAGSLYALLPAALKHFRGVHEVISTIMLNWVAVSVVENWLVVGPLKAKASGVLSISGTDQIHPTAQLPRLLGDVSRLNFGLVVAAVAAVGTWLFLGRFRRGFEWKVIGHNSAAAQAAGISVGRGLFEAMALSGALAGLAGAALVLGTELKYPTAISAPYGFDGIAVALIGNGHPLGVFGAALLFGSLNAGGTRMQLLGIHKSFPELIQGLALLLLTARLLWDRLLLLSPRRKVASP